MDLRRLNFIKKIALDYKNKFFLHKTARSWALKVFADFNDSSNDSLMNFSLDLQNIVNTKIHAKDIKEWIEINKSILNDFKFSLENWNYYKDNVIEVLTCNNNGNYMISAYPINFEKSGSDMFYKPKKEAVLLGNANIPKLYIYEVEYFYKDLNQDFLSMVKKEYYPYFFLVDFFAEDNKEDFKNLSNEEKANFVESFIDNNKQILNNILRFSNIAPKVLGAGADGVAFDLGQNKVLKIFSDSFSYNKSIETINNLHNQSSGADTEIMIYDAGKLNYYKDLYYYIIEKVTVIRSLPLKDFNDINKIIFAIVSSILAEKQAWDSIKDKKIGLDSDIVKEKIDDIIFMLKSQYKQKIDSLTKIYNLASETNKPQWAGMLKGVKLNDWVSSLVREIVNKFLTGRGDMHTGNIGITSSGYFRFFDAAHEIWQKSINTSVPANTNNVVNVVNDGQTVPIN
jgi:hypothetical protein